MAIIGYIRISSNKQTYDHQFFEIKQFSQHNNICINKWVTETITSRQPLNKRKLGKLLDHLQTGDILIAAEISRLGRSLLEIMQILEKCLNNNCQVWTIKENYRLGNDIQSKVMAFAFGLSAEIECNLISQRTKASLESIRASGKRLGRPLSSQSKKLKLSNHTTKIQQWRNAGISKYKIAQKLAVSPSTVSNFINRMERQTNNI